MAINRTSPKKGKVVDIPDAPTIGTVATYGATTAAVPFTAATKGGPVTTFEVFSGATSYGTGTSSPVTASGLTANTAYTFTVKGKNATGYSEASAASASITTLNAKAFDALIVAGGGAPGEGYGGGGGAGGLLYSSPSLINGSTYTITVGAGGVKVNGARGANGGDSVLSGSAITTLTAVGGGGGGNNTGSGKNGGSGGGGGGFNNTAGAGTAGQGNDGGAGSSSAPGGGGGAGGGGGRPNGGVGSSVYSAWGAATTSGQNVSGTYYYAGGGAAATGGGLGGYGGGGNVDTSATANTGGGGGANNGNGGSGILILRTPGSYTASATTGSPSRVESGGYTYYKFTGNGSITI